MRKYFLTHSMRTALPQYQIRQDIIGKEIMDWCLSWTAAAAAKSLQSCPTLCDPIDGSPPGSPVPGILQARTLEWVAISFSSAWTWKVKVKSLSRVRLLVTPWTAAHQAPPSMGFSRQEHWSGSPVPSPDPALAFCYSSSTPYVYCCFGLFFLFFFYWSILPLQHGETLCSESSLVSGANHIDIVRMSMA